MILMMREPLFAKSGSRALLKKLLIYIFLLTVFVTVFFFYKLIILKSFGKEREKDFLQKVFLALYTFPKNSSRLLCKVLRFVDWA
jgi:hypothetical protein